MSLVYKCDFYGTTTENVNQYPQARVITISGNQINGEDVDIELAITLSIPTVSDRIHVSGAAWKDVAQIVKAWLDATFP